MKDTWTKPRGRMEAGREVGLAGVEWGENADNCN